MRYKLQRCLTGILSAALLVLGATSISAQAANFTRVDEGVIFDASANRYYFNSMMGGARAFIPLTYGRSSHNQPMIANAMLSLPGMQTGFGDWASRAAFRYTGFNSIKGSSAQYLVKYAQADTSPYDGTVWMEPSWDIGVDRKITFRYAGMVINGKGQSGSTSVPVIAGTNPYFPSDTITTSSAGGSAITANLWTQTNANNDTVWSRSEQTVYGTPGGVHQLADVYTNGMNGTSYHSGVGNVLSNKYTDFNLDYAEIAFNRWLDSGDEYGQAYKAEAETWIQQNNSNLEWWQVLNQFFQINGNPTDPNQTLYFYMVGGVRSGHTYYNTYAEQASIPKNVSPTLFTIKDNETGQILTESYRQHDTMTATDGIKGEVMGPTVQLIPGHHYTVEGVMTYYSDTAEPSKSNRGADFYALGAGTSAKPIPLNESMLQPVSSLPDESAILHKSPTDGKSNGPVTPSKSHTAVASDTGETYYYNGAGFANITFTVNDAMAQNNTGYLVLAVPEEATRTADNACQNDDVLYIRYVLDTVPDPGDKPQNPNDPAFGDMNLGMPEYRELHYIMEEEEEPEGEPAEGEEPPEPIIVEYEVNSDYGYYRTAEQADGNLVDKKENGEPKHPNGKDIWRADMVSDATSQPWWEYTDRIWPDQTADLENKCWLTDATGTWIEDGEFRRSFNGENQFGFGFRVSRSRGEDNSKINAGKVDVQIYGVSPDTGEDGVLLKEYTEGGKDYKTVQTNGSIGVYEYSDAFIRNLVSSKAVNGIEDFPRIRVKAKISDDHGESQLFKNYYREPAENSWEEEHDTVDRTFVAEMDDMRIVEVEIKDSEGIVIYHADRYDTGVMETVVNGYFDREEDLYMKVVVEQNLEAGHAVKDPAIDVFIVGTNEEGQTERTYVDMTYTLEGTTMGQGATVTFDQIAFRPKSAEKLKFSIAINEKHGEDEWRENIWDDEEDSVGFVLAGTTADLALSQDIEAYNSKSNPQDYLTFAEYMSFKFNIRHIGQSSRQTAVVGGSAVNPYAKVNVKIYNADALTQSPQDYHLIYRMAEMDPKANAALIMDGDIQAKTRLYPGLGANGFASHVQAWFKDYIVQSFVTPTGNVAAYGHILVSGKIDSYHDANNTNIRDNTVDYVQKEFFGEKNFKIVDIGVSSRNSISEDTGLAVQVAIQNAASSYNDQTIVDKTYLDIYIDDELKKTIQVEVPVGDTIVTELVFEDMDLDDCKVVEARVNTGTHQTHYEYVLRTTDGSLYPDPFVDNYRSIVVCPNLPDVTVCPLCVIDDDVQVDDIFGDGSTDGGYNPVPDQSKYQIVYEINDGSGANSIQSVNFNSTINLKGNPFTKQGYEFLGWTTAPDGSGTRYDDRAVLTIGSKQSYGDDTILHLYAQWAPISYTIRFDPNGGSGSMDPITLSFDETRHLPNNTFTKADYIFGGWNTRSDGSGISVENGGSIKNFAGASGETVTLYAQWISEVDCAILENFNAGSALGLKPGDVVAENPSLISYVDYSTYGYIRVRIPTISACKAGDGNIEKIYDLFTPNWNTRDWVLIRSSVSQTEGIPSEYIWRYKTQLAPADSRDPSSVDDERRANRSTDLYTKVTIGDFTSGGSLRAQTELVGVVVESSSGSVGTIDNPGLTDQVAFGLFDSLN